MHKNKNKGKGKYIMLSNEKSRLVNIHNRDCKTKEITKLGIKAEKGITLIALIITIIVLLILSAISLSLVFNQDGIFSRTKSARTKYENGAVYENLLLRLQEFNIEKVEKRIDKSELSVFQEEHYINNDGILNMEKMPKSIQSGYGSKENGDIYLIKQIGGMGDYYLFYYDEKNNENNIGFLFKNIGEISTKSITAKVNIKNEKEVYYLGEIIEYELIIKNEGNVPVNKIQITASEVDTEIEQLASDEILKQGESKTILCSYRNMQDNKKTGIVDRRN